MAHFVLNCSEPLPGLTVRTGQWVKCSHYESTLGPRFESWRAHHLPLKSLAYGIETEVSESLGADHRGLTRGSGLGAM